MSIRTKDFAWAACSTISPTMRSARAWVEVHADLGEFDADVGVQVAGFDCVEELVIDVRGFLRFCLGR